MRPINRFVKHRIACEIVFSLIFYGILAVFIYLFFGLPALTRMIEIKISLYILAPIIIMVVFLHYLRFQWDRGRWHAKLVEELGSNLTLFLISADILLAIVVIEIFKRYNGAGS